MKLPTILAGLAVFTTLALVGGGLTYYKMKQISDASNAPPMPEFGESAHIEAVRELQWQPMSDLVGTAFSLRSVRMSNELAGTVTKVLFESGSIIEEGSVLLMLDDATERADLAAAEASIRVAEANVVVGQARLSLAETEMHAVEEANANNAATPIEVDRRRAELASARAELDRLRAEVDQMRSRVEQIKVLLDKRTIRAPFRGRAGLRTVHEGQYLAEGTQFVLLEEVTDRIYLDFAIPQEYLARVRLGLKVKATSAVLGNEPVDIEVVAIDATVNNDTRNVRVRGIVNNPPVENGPGGPSGEGRIRPGMFVQIRVPVDAPKPYIVVPATAVRRATHGDHVWVVVPGEAPDVMRAKQRPVKLGPAVGDDVIVLEGLAMGERVATTGSFKLREGVKVVDMATMTTPAAGASSASSH